MSDCFSIFETAHGFCAILWSESGVRGLLLPARSRVESERSLRRRAPRAGLKDPPPAIGALIGAIQRYFEGERIDFCDFRIDLREQDDFFREIYAATRRLGWGSTTTYGALAKELGAGAEAARTVGEAMAKNPLPLIIPCHRVLAAGGKPGGFSAPGGTSAKLRMLELEGVRLGVSTSAQSDLFARTER